jgi:hypothetical protein
MKKTNIRKKSKSLNPLPRGLSNGTRPKDGVFEVLNVTSINRDVGVACHLGADNHSEPTAEILLSGNPNTGSSATSASLFFYRDARQNEKPRYVPEQKQICLYFPLDQFLPVQTALAAGKNRRCFFRSAPEFDEAWGWIEVN